MTVATWDDVHGRLLRLQGRVLDQISESPGDAELVGLYRKLGECLSLVAELREYVSAPGRGGVR